MSQTIPGTRLSSDHCAGAPAVPVSAEVLRRFDVPGPRYTSYPTADRLVETGDQTGLRQALQRRASNAVGTPLSLYVHLPFCESICYYCACNKVITRDHSRVAPYLQALEREMALYGEALGPHRSVSQLHLGGGTPTYLSDAELDRLMASLRRWFELRADAELSIEVDPRTVTQERLAHLAQLGFNRLSFGVQDFDERVQRAVHRLQPHDMVRDLVGAARDIGFESINVDLIYGLPEQTSESFARTVDQVTALRPDRVALYAYAHLPLRFKPQRRIRPLDLPSPADRVDMLAESIGAFLAAGYDHIGMDHFALKTDALARAKQAGRLHRNFQGYSTQPDCDLIGLGVSAIGKLDGFYTQNFKTLPSYFDALERSHLPAARSLLMSRDDVVRRDMIMSLMCQGTLDFRAIQATHGIDVQQHFRLELAQLASMAENGLLSLNDQGVEVTPTGWFFVRGIAMVFDRYLRAAKEREQFSRVA
jgi:oxygen-independent coproporphyrinogen-3 oxidase